MINDLDYRRKNKVKEGVEEMITYIEIEGI